MAEVLHVAPGTIGSLLPPAGGRLPGRAPGRWVFAVVLLVLPLAGCSLLQSGTDLPCTASRQALTVEFAELFGRVTEEDPGLDLSSPETCFALVDVDADPMADAAFMVELVADAVEPHGWTRTGEMEWVDIRGFTVWLRIDPPDPWFTHREVLVYGTAAR